MLMPKFKILLLCSYGFVINTYQKHMTLKRVTCPNMDKSEIHAARAGKCTSYVTSHPNKDIFKQEKKTKKTHLRTSVKTLQRYELLYIRNDRHNFFCKAKCFTTAPVS